MTYAAAVALAQALLDRQVKSVAEAAFTLARFVVAHEADAAEMLANLTRTQARCTELLEENRQLRASLGATPSEPLVPG